MNLKSIIELDSFHLLFLNLSDKGGVGKSNFAKVLTHHCLTNYPEETVLVECDRSNPDVRRIYNNKIKDITLAFFSEDPSKESNGDPLFNAACNNRITICNLPAQVHQAFNAWFKAGYIAELSAKNKIGLINFHLAGSSRDTSKLFLKNVRDFSSYMQIVLVRNHGLCDDWTHLDENEEVQEAIAKHNIHIIDFPRIPYAERNFLEENQLTFAEALEHPNLGLVPRQRITEFLRICSDQIESIEFFSYGK